MLYKPEKACNIIMACAVLHNIALAHGVPLPEEQYQPDEEMPIDPPPENPHPRAARRREDLINLF